MPRFLSLVLLLHLVSCARHHFVEPQANGVTASLESPAATEVFFASSVDNFQLHLTTRDSRGLWTITSLADQEFRYFYVVDGKTYLPDCRYQERDDFGAINCVYQP